MSSCYENVISFFDGQWIIGESGKNGGDIVAWRSLWVGTWLILITIGLQALVDPDRHGPITWHGFFSQLSGLGAVIGGIYGGTYAAFYARFVSQWSYLANLYNLIKQAESTGGAKTEVLAQWKAGYIEDAETLHLLCKRSVAPVVKSWATDKSVVKAYTEHTPGGDARLRRIQHAVEAACAKLELEESTRAE